MEEPGLYAPGYGHYIAGKGQAVHREKDSGRFGSPLQLRRLRGKQKPQGGYTKKMVAVYDSLSITRNEVDTEIAAYPIGYDKRVVFMPKEQFETVFRSLLPGENSES